MTHETKYKPGPWFKLSGGDDRINITTTVGPHWANVENFIGVAHGIGNARLIAAAPELLEALHEVYANVTFSDVGPEWKLDGATVARVKAAIAKAEGRTP